METSGQKVSVKLISAKDRVYLTTIGNFLVREIFVKRLIVSGVIDNVANISDLRKILTPDEVNIARDMGLIVPVHMDPEYVSPIITKDE